MSDIVLVLGPVAFSDFEVPERIRFGGAQRLTVHKLPGGARVIDALGPDDTELGWSGIFAGPDATERALLLDQLRVRGAVLPLKSWNSRQRNAYTQTARATGSGKSGAVQSYVLVRPNLLPDEALKLAQNWLAA